MLEVLMLAVALAADATAASAGLGATQPSLRPVVLGAVLFAVFQAGMSAVGWFGGHHLTTWAAAWDHWIAFTLLVGIGGRTVWGALSAADDDVTGPAHLGVLLALSVATSIDALAAGVSLPLLPVHGAVSVAVIGLVTLVMSGLGGLLGRSAGERLGAHFEIGGGVVLVLLGCKILAEHLLVG